MDTAILLRALDDTPDSITLGELTMRCRESADTLAQKYRLELLERFHRLRTLTAGTIRRIAKREPELLHTIICARKKLNVDLE